MQDRSWGKTVLIVEDDADDQCLTTLALADAGMPGSVQLLAEGRQAVVYMMAECTCPNRASFPYPSLNITDLCLPDADGFTVLEHLKANPAWALVPTVFLSGSSDTDHIRTAYQLGASSYHLKPAGYNARLALLKVLYEFWMSCEVPTAQPLERIGYWMACGVPEVDTTGKRLPPKPAGRLGEGFALCEESASGSAQA